MDILTKINTLPNEIQNLIFYYVIQTEAYLIRNIDWKKEYKNTFFKQNISNKLFSTHKSNIFGNNNGISKVEILTNENGISHIYRTIGKSYLQRVGFKAFDYKDKQIYELRQQCIDNGITKFNKNNRISMIKKLMKI